MPLQNIVLYLCLNRRFIVNAFDRNSTKKQNQLFEVLFSLNYIYRTIYFSYFKGAQFFADWYLQ